MKIMKERKDKRDLKKQPSATKRDTERKNERKRERETEKERY